MYTVSRHHFKDNYTIPDTLMLYPNLKSRKFITKAEEEKSSFELGTSFRCNIPNPNYPTIFNNISLLLKVKMHLECQTKFNASQEKISSFSKRIKQVKIHSYNFISPILNFKIFLCFFYLPCRVMIY